MKYQPSLNFWRGLRKLVGLVSIAAAIWIDNRTANKVSKEWLDANA